MQRLQELRDARFKEGLKVLLGPVTIPPPAPPPPLVAFTLEWTEGWESIGWLANHEYRKNLRRLERKRLRSINGDTRALDQEDEDWRQMRNTEIKKWESILPEGSRQYSASELVSKARDKLHKLTYVPPRRITEVENKPIDSVRAYRQFQDGLREIRRDPTKFSEHAFHGPIPELERNGFSLKPFQREGVGQLLNKTERYQCALLGDAMGLGKTAQIVAFLVIKKKEWLRMGKEAPSFLVVVPTALIDNWKEELARASNLKVAIYHKATTRQLPTLKELLNVDVVITTYETLYDQYKALNETEASFRRGYDGLDKFYEAAEVVLQRRAKGMLIGGGEVGRRILPESRTTRPSAPLFAIGWLATIIDEAHKVKNLHSKQGHALSRLDTKYRIAISGTPFQNNQWDLYAQLRWFGFSEWANLQLFRESFDMKSNKKRKRGELRQNKLSNHLLACILYNVTIRRKQGDTFEGELVSVTKKVREITWKLKLDAEDAMDPEDQAKLFARIKELMEKHTPTKKKRTDGEDDEMVRKENNTLKELHQQRMNCIHPLLNEAKYTEDADSAFLQYQWALVKADMLDSSNPEERDGAVDQDVAARNERNIEKTFRKFKSQEAAKQPGASQTSSKEVRKAFCDRIKKLPDGWRSSKTVAIVNVVDLCLRRIDKEADYSNYPDEYKAWNKIIIFSEFLGALDILQIGLEEDVPGLKCARYDGTLTHDERRKVVDEYEERGKDYRSIPSPNWSPHRVLLATNKSMAEGLNLIHTRHVMFVAHCWNPFVESQAIARAVRSGNPNAVEVHRFHVLKSIESAVHLICQEKQRNVRAYEDLAFIRSSQELHNMSEESFLKALGRGTDVVKDLFEEFREQEEIREAGEVP